MLGAGNCNDLDLSELASWFSEIHLVDVDGEALARGVRRVRPENRAALHVHSGMDVTGICARLAQWSRDSPCHDEIAGLLDDMRVPRLSLVGVYDVIVSACLLSQLIDMVVIALGERHPAVDAVVLALRDAHLRLLVSLLAPGGSAVFASELVSTDTEPGFERISEADIPRHVRRLLAEGNFFTGTNPFAIRERFVRDAYLSPRIASLRFGGYWRWRMSAQSTYLVYALVAQVRGDLA